jgi:hypothetical protein
MPRDLAELTDWQILFMYLSPRAKQLEQLRKEFANQSSVGREYQTSYNPVQLSRQDLPRQEMPHPDVDAPDFRDWFIRTTAGYMGLDQAKREFDVQMNEFKNAPKDAWWRVQK